MFEMSEDMKTISNIEEAHVPVTYYCSAVCGNEELRTVKIRGADRGKLNLDRSSRFKAFRRWSPDPLDRVTAFF